MKNFYELVGTRERLIKLMDQYGIRSKLQYNTFGYTAKIVISEEDYNFLKLIDRLDKISVYSNSEVFKINEQRIPNNFENNFPNGHYSYF